MKEKKERRGWEFQHPRDKVVIRIWVNYLNNHPTNRLFLFESPNYKKFELGTITLDSR